MSSFSSMKVKAMFLDIFSIISAFKFGIRYANVFRLDLSTCRLVTVDFGRDREEIS